MSSTVNSMQLTMWDSRTDAYSHVDLVNNWLKIAEHDHTAGHGIQIPGPGIEDGAIGANHIDAGALPGSKLTDGTVDLIKLSVSLLASLCPLGVALTWTRLHPSQVIPAGPGTLFEIPHGQTLLAADHDVPGVVGSITLPDYTSRFVFWVVNADGTGTQVVGGSNVAALAHSHVVAPHTHPVDSHIHQVLPHSHDVNAHSHGIGADGFHAHGIVTDGSHNHTFSDDGGGGRNLQSRHVGDPVGGERQALYIPGFNSGEASAVAPMRASGDHAHGGATVGAGTHSHGGQTASTNGATSPSSPNTAETAPTAREPLTTVNTAGALSNGFDIRPAYITAIPLMRVRNP